MFRKLYYTYRKITPLPTPEYLWVSKMLGAIDQHPHTRMFFINFYKRENRIDNIPKEILNSTEVQYSGHTGGTLSYTARVAGEILSKGTSLKCDEKIPSPYAKIVKSWFD